jgi:hypothetical protein
MSYPGPERRRRHVYVTRNTEYHLFDETCVGVRDRSSKQWVQRHKALRRRLEGGVRIYSNGAVCPSLDEPAVGDAIYFVIDDNGEDLVTSKLVSIGRPSRDDLMRYPVAS